MSHNLAKGTHGNYAYFGAVEAAWHGLGVTLDKPATAEEALRVAGLDYEVEKRPIYIKSGRKQILIPNRMATVRKDTEEYLGVVGSGYGVLQNRNAFTFFDALVDTKEAIYHTAGALGKGERAWVLAKLPDYIRIGKTDDIIEKYVLIYHGHDGKTGVTCMLTPVRVVCQNTLQMALLDARKMVGTDADVAQKITLSHTKNIETKIKEASAMMGLISKRTAVMSDAYNAMVKVKLTPDTLDAYLNDVWRRIPGTRKDEDLEEGEMIMSDDIYEQLSRYLEEGPGQDMKTAKGTLFGAYNAITGWADHVKEYNGDKLKSLWFNGGKQIKTAAWNQAIAMIS